MSHPAAVFARLERPSNRWHLAHEVRSRRRIAEKSELRACCSAPSSTHRRRISEVRCHTSGRTALCGFAARRVWQARRERHKGPRPLGAVAWSDGQPDFAEPLVASPVEDFGTALWTAFPELNYIGVKDRFWKKAFLFQMKTLQRQVFTDRLNARLRTWRILEEGKLDMEGASARLGPSWSPVLKRKCQRHFRSL